MDAIEFLTQQHREVESLFDQFESASARIKLRLCRKMSDLLTVHTAIEEKLLYPAARDARTGNVLDHAIEEHLSVMRIVGDLVEMDEMNDEAVAMMSALRKLKREHFEEEERVLFPMAREVLASAGREILGRRMERMADQLMCGAEAGRAGRPAPETSDEGEPDGARIYVLPLHAHRR